MKHIIKRYLFMIVIFMLSFCNYSTSAYSLSYDSKPTKEAIDLFSDIKSSDWFYDITNKLIKQNIIYGYPDSTLRPRDFISKAEFIALLLRAGGYNETIDKDIWYKNYITRGAKLGIINEEELEEYRRYIGTYGIAEMVCKLLDIEPITSKEVIFSDIEEDYKNINTEWLNAAFKERLIVGFYYDNSFISRPYRSITRAEAFEIISNLIDYKSNKTAYMDKVSSSINLLRKNECMMFSNWNEYLNKEIEYPNQIKEYIDKNYLKESIYTLNIGNYTYTIITSGPKPSSGYDIALKEAYEKDNELVFKVNYLNPSGGYLNLITYPVAIFKIDNSNNNYSLNYIIEK